MIKVIIVDDHPIFINGLKQLIDSQPNISVIGTAENCKEFYSLVEISNPDIILLDINLPDGNGIDLCNSIHEKTAEIGIIAVSSFSEYVYINKMLSNGANGYLLKNANPKEFIDAINDVYNGRKYISQEIQTILNAKEKQNKLHLTKRETELLILVAEGYTNAEIADKLFLGVETIKSYRKTLLLKLGAKNTAAMVKMAITEKLI